MVVEVVGGGLGGLRSSISLSCLSVAKMRAVEKEADRL